MLEKDSVRVEANDLSRHTDALAEQIRDAFRAAAQIEAAPSLSDTDLVQHDGRVRCERGALDVQPLDLASAPLDRVVTLWWFSHRIAGSASGVRATLHPCTKGKLKKTAPHGDVRGAPLMERVGFREQSGCERSRFNPTALAPGKPKPQQGQADDSRLFRSLDHLSPLNLFRLTPLKPTLKFVGFDRLSHR